MSLLVLRAIVGRGLLRRVQVADGGLWVEYLAHELGPRRIAWVEATPEVTIFVIDVLIPRVLGLDELAPATGA